MRAGFIGYRNFAERLRGLFEQSELVGQFTLYHPNKIEGGTTKLEDLFDCDFIVIASPDWTHGSYLRQLQAYKGYIFCEKIPVISREDLLFLKSHPNPLLYFNFNYRKSRLFDLLQEGILHISQWYSNSLALTEEYRGNWRSDASKAPLGVFQLSGIHLFDLLVFCFGRPVSYHTIAKNLSPYGNSIDNFGINLEFSNGETADLFLSYTAPFHFSINVITMKSFFQFNNLDFYNESLRNSVDYFLNIVQSGGYFREAQTESNLLSTELFLDILDEVL